MLCAAFVSYVYICVLQVTLHFYIYIYVYICIRRDNIIHLMKQLKEAYLLTDRIKRAIEQKHQKFDDTCGIIQNIGNERQVVSFLLWITKNADKLSLVSIYMLYIDVSMLICCVV